jgi:NADH:ubiquinone reductase (H+-translocating)
MKHVIVIGGGFAGLNLVKRLAKDKKIRITLVDRNNYCFFPPMLYQVATGLLEPSNISYPFRKMLRKHPNISMRMAELLHILPDQNTVVLSNGELKYDHLVIASGVTTNYFGMKNIREGAIPMKTLSDALRLRNHLLEQIEKASEDVSDRERTKYLTIVIVGNGPTGVELAGMLADMQRDILYRDHPELKASAVLPHIVLADGNDRVLGAMSPQNSKYCLESLSGMAVDVRFGLVVKDYADGKVLFSNGEIIETKTLIWAAGIVGQRFEGLPADAFGPGSRIKVDPFNRVTGTDNIYAIGDACIQMHEANFPKGHPQMAQVGIQQGRNLADNLRAGEDSKPFWYTNKGSMAIIGRNRAVVDIPNGRHFQGFIAWTMWLGVHLLSLWRPRNRIATLSNWVVAYFTRDQANRMIIRPSKEEPAAVSA